MLGRLRMPVSDCIMEYERLGGKIFGHPHKFHALNIPLMKRPKYSTLNFQTIIQRLVESRLEGGIREMEMGKDLCKT